MIRPLPACAWFIIFVYCQLSGIKSEKCLQHPFTVSAYKEVDLIVSLSRNLISHALHQASHFLFQRARVSTPCKKAWTCIERKKTLRQKYNERISSPSFFHACCMVVFQERLLLSAVGHPVFPTAYTIHLSSTTLPCSIFILSPCLLSFRDSRTLGRLISSQIIKALQPGLVVHPVLDLFRDAIICCVITSFVLPSVTAFAWSEVNASD